jgi:hypothetical protein
MNTELNKIRMDNKKNDDCIIVTGDKYNFICDHFPHAMEYFYYATDIILDTSYLVIVIEPAVKYKSNYVLGFIENMYKNFDNFVFLKWGSESNIKNIKTYKFLHHNYRMINETFLINYPYSSFNDSFKEVNDQYRNWFANKNASIMRDLFIKKKNFDKVINIGLINRKYNRVLTNYNEICEKIYEKFNVKVDVTYFEDTTFNYQINFFYDHNIIISAHGAALTSIPFMSDNSLLIECASDEFHPYSFFPGLSLTSNNYHVMICNDHSGFPKPYNLIKSRPKMNITINNCEKIIDLIDFYIKNNNKLEKYNCYLI